MLTLYFFTTFSTEANIFLSRELGEADSQAEPELNVELLAQIHSHQLFLIQLLTVTYIEDILENKPEYCKV
jgi:hypothetical protein